MLPRVKTKFMYFIDTPLIIQPSPIGCIPRALALLGWSKSDSAVRAFDSDSRDVERSGVTGTTSIPRSDACYIT